MKKLPRLSKLLSIGLVAGFGSAIAADLTICRNTPYELLISDSAGGGATYTWSASIGQVLSNTTMTNNTGHICYAIDAGRPGRWNNLVSTPYAPTLFGSGNGHCPVNSQPF